MKQLFSSLRFRILAAVMILMFVAVAILIINTYFKLRNDIIMKNEEAFKSFSTIFDTEKELLIKKYAMSLDVLLENQLITEAFARRDREVLASLITQLYNTRLKHLYKIDQFQFHTPPAVSFYRAHIPEKYGDNLESFRKTVLKANETKSTVAGIEAGRGGLGLRVVKPVWYNFDAVGTVELGGDIDSLLQTTKDCTGINYSIGIFKNVLENARFLEDSSTWMPYKDMLVYNFSEDTVRELMVSGQFENRNIISLNGRSYMTKKVPLYDYSSEQIGYLLIARDTTKDLSLMNAELIKQSIIIAAYGIIAVILLSSFLIKLIFRPLEQISKHLSTAEISLSSPPSVLEVNNNNELSLLADAYNSLNTRLYNNLLQIDDQIKQIQHINFTLEDKVKTRTSELEESNEKLNKALENYKTINEAKSEFLADMSHEIRTPMNAIIGLSYLAMQTGLNAKQYEYISKINSSANMMLEIINDILDFSKIEAGRLELDSINFSILDVITKVKDILEIQAEKKKIAFNIVIDEKVPNFVKGDPLRLSQVLNNLGANAVKYTEEGNVTISVDPIESNMAYTTLKFTVKDTGIGIPQDKIGSLFTSYNQVSSKVSRKYGGSGLGLNITKKILDKMGGSIFVESIPDKGSVFWFTVRFKNVDITKTEDFSEKAKLLKGKRILVAEKDPEQPSSVSAIFRRFLADVVCADNHISLIKILGSNADNNNRIKFDLIVFEQVLNDTHLVSFLDSIKESMPNAVFPEIIYISNDAIDTDSDFKITLIEKPATPNILFKTSLNLLTGINSDEIKEIDITADASSAKVLIVDDNRINRDVAGEFMKLLGAEFMTAENGLEAVRMAEKEEFDIIFMDIMMPQLDGYAASKLIRENGKNTATPIYAMTASVIDEDSLKRKSALITGSVSKPYKLNEISKAISESKLLKSKADRTIPVDLSGNIDFETGISNFGGNIVLYKKAACEFVAVFNNRENIKSTIMTDDYDALKSSLLTIRDYAENLSMHSLLNSVRQAYEKLSTSSPMDTGKELVHVKEELIRAVDIIRNHFS